MDHTINHWDAFLALKEAQPGLRQREGAEQLNIGEGALLAHAPGVVYLGTDVRAILPKLATVGPLQCTVRNDYAVHEKVGVYENLTISPMFGLAVNVGGIDVRLFMQRWKHAFAFDGVGHGGKTLRSIQFYDDYGLALQKVYLQDEAHLPAWQALIEAFKTTDVAEFQTGFQHEEKPTPELSTEELAMFQARWMDMKDIHQFNVLISEYGLTRTEAFKRAPSGFAFRMEGHAAIEAAYTAAVAKGTPIMTFVGNRGAVQIETGVVHNLKRMGGWFNIFDGKENGFVLHLQDEGIAEVWMVCRPTKDGLVTCLEAFDANGDIVLTLFGQRLEGEQELSEWRDIVTEVSGQAIPEEAVL